MSSRWSVCLGIALLAWPLMAVAADKDDDAYIKVEMKGTIKTGIVAIGGETTGTTITVKDVTWELDLGGNKELAAAADKLNGKPALVTGTFTKVKGVERGERNVVKVTNLKALDGK